jgi:hypothetical protein
MRKEHAADRPKSLGLRVGEEFLVGDKEASI